MIDLKDIQTQLIDDLQQTLDSIKQIQIPEASQAFQLTTADIHNQDNIKKLAAQLPVKGSHIYWFEVDTPKELIKVFTDRADKVSYKCARENKHNNSHYVYVGSCTTTKLSDRFKQHCGWGNDHTYSLQLRKWIGDNAFSFTLNYVEVGTTSLVQLIEDQLHKNLKPLFGKPGSNNKVKAVK